MEVHLQAAAPQRDVLGDGICGRGHTGRVTQVADPSPIDARRVLPDGFEQGRDGAIAE